MLKIQHGVGSALYAMLRQALASRRALLLLDGLDEGGRYLPEIQRHVTEVLAPQGHILLVTSRPTISEAHFTRFERLRLAPLSETQQRVALEQRLGAARAEQLLPYLERFPRDVETGNRVTSNPLMLSMVASVFEIYAGLEMPSNLADLYQVAISAFSHLP